ncbi:monooxygenase [Coprinopsis sp. MPI-PUGE-AT-0042]|nr:monooxygenase [Coprinopsis sp. MPI-PUGE-AT-0042]
MPLLRPSSIKVAIVGGGPGGLTLANILKNIGIPFTALKKAGLLPEFKRRMRIEATEFYLRDHTGKVRIHQEAESEEDPERPEIDRTELRSLLLDALDSADVQWGKKLSRGERLEDGSFKLHFANGTTADDGFNVLVGADGSLVQAFVGNGTCMITSGESMTVAAEGRQWNRESLFLHPSGRRLEGEIGKSRDLFIECDEGELAVRPIYMFGPDHTFEKQLPGVTLLGDAAHAISPFAGTGVNNAMFDAFELSVALEKIAFDGANADALLLEYEKGILERAAVDGEECRKNQEMWLTGKPVDEIVAQFEVHVRRRSPRFGVEALPA